ncbi:TetR/AcrR family transcriptional regulator [Actinomadura parmotrematis]|uniref:TetR/AcrR family transcriptional regulator n=1 Tax=Actinomadura parmotrematis TaxID=2864039 RepID=A0ABS7FVV7_9ACTN|nr:TetR/AcrR family transcriptional regulator [Actinomadura parmotrematis]MBW8484559.1 TetR/AcrR family transcriptional regulator [Actinomadura parmotrematis]
MGETGTKRGRPRGFDRAAALEAATRLFWAHGYGATSIGELTGAMGIRPGSLYAAFGDKESLFREVVQNYGRSSAGGFIGVALREERTARGAVARILREAAVVYSDPSHPAGCLTISAATNVTPQDAAIEAFLRDLRTEGLAAMEARLRKAREDGELPADTDPRSLAAYFAAVVQGMSQRARDGATAAELTSTAELAMKAWPAPDTGSSEDSTLATG